MEDANRGHLLFANKLATDTGALSFQDKDGLDRRILFNYTRYNDDCDQQKHDNLLNKLLHEDKVHFVFGSTPVFALPESIMANDAERLIYHCCVGPDLLYEKNMPHVFGIQTSNVKYSLQSLKSMALAGGVQRLFIFYLENNIFTSSTCQAAIDYSESVLRRLNPAFEVVHIKKYSSQNASADPLFYENVVAEAVATEADALLGCDFKDPGITVTREVHRRQYYLKALWLTVAPAYDEFASVLPAAASENALTAGQWHHAQEYADSYFGTTEDYSAKFRDLFQIQPSYVAAGASAASLSLAVAIQEAFTLCTVYDQDVSADDLLFNQKAIQCINPIGEPVASHGYALVKDSLSSQKLNTFFGEVEFNRFRRNIAKDPATTQVQAGIIEAVLPLEYANKALVMPNPKPVIDVSVKDRGPAKIGRLQKEAFIVVVVVVVGSVLLLCLSACGFFWWHRHQRQKIIDHLVISHEDLQIINMPVRRWDGSFESGTAIYRNALVSLEPLVEARLCGILDSDASRSSKLGAQIPATAYYNQDLLCSTEVVKVQSRAEVWCNQRSSFQTLSQLDSIGDIDAYIQSTQVARPKKSGIKRTSLEKPDTRVQFEPVVQISLVGTEDGDPNGLRMAKTDAGSDTSYVQLPYPPPSNPESTGAALCSPSTAVTLTKRQVLKLLWSSKCLQHPSVVPMLGIVWSLPSLPPNMPVLVEECQELGALSSVMENETMELDAIKKIDIAKDLAQAMSYLHAQDHPRLKSFLKPRLADVTLNRHCRAKLRVPLTSLTDVLSSDKTCMPCLAGHHEALVLTGNQDGHQSIVVHPDTVQGEELEDVQRYGAGIAYMLTKGGDSSGLLSFTNGTYLISDDVVEESVLPTAQYRAVQAEHGPDLAKLLLKCCATNAHERPSFSEIHLELETKGHEMVQNAFIAHQTSLRQRNLSTSNKASADELLYELFPVEVAEALKCGRTPDPQPYPEVSLFFSDVCGYTDICSRLAPQEVMDMLHRLYSRFDELAQELCLFKVETVGDAYLLVANLKHPQPDCHARLIAKFAFGCIAAANAELICPSKPELGCIHIRVGVHAGPVMGAVVGTLNRRFGLFGDAVNVASRMESTSIKDHVQCSASFMRLLKEQWPGSARRAMALGARSIKGKGTMNTFFLFPPNEAEQPSAAHQSCPKHLSAMPKEYAHVQEDRGTAGTIEPTSILVHDFDLQIQQLDRVPCDEP